MHFRELFGCLWSFLMLGVVALVIGVAASNGKLLHLIGGIVGLALLIVVPTSYLSARKLERARREFREIQNAHPYDAREHCPHRVHTLGQTGVPGVVTMTTKWCRICGACLGPAKLRESVFGNRWE